MLAELRARQAAPPAPAINQPVPPADPNFDWSRLVLLTETNFQVPGDGQVQRMASSLFARVPTLAGCDQHEARFDLQVISLWPDLQDEERAWAFQRLNVYCIVAVLGWPAATAACASTTAITDFVLPPGVVLPPPAAPRRNRRENQPAVAPQQQCKGRHNTTSGDGEVEHPETTRPFVICSLLNLITVQTVSRGHSGSCFVPVFTVAGKFTFLLYVSLYAFERRVHSLNQFRPLV